MSSDEVQKLVQELQIHQIELEMQNDELQNALAELELARDQYVDLYDFAPVGYLTLDADGVILESNLTAATILGTERQQLVGNRFALSIASDDRDNLHQHLHQLLETGERACCRLIANSPIDSLTTIQLESTVRRVADKVQLRITLSDITQTRQLEEALEAKTQQLRWADALPILIAYFTPDLCFHFCNSAHQTWFGQTPEDLQGRHVLEIFAKYCHDAIEGHLLDAMGGYLIDIESQLDHQKDGQRHVRMMFVPDSSANGEINGVHCLCIDITEQKIVENQQARHRQFSARLTELNKGELAAYELLVRGMSNKEVADELDVGLRTVERYRSNILSKMGVGSLTELLNNRAESRGIDATQLTDPAV